MKRKWLLFVPVLIVAGWWAFRGSAPIVPPTIACGEPVIQRALNRAREEVIAQPGDAGKWGHYGKLLRAHGRDAEAGECFERAAQLDPNDPTWPYFIG